MSGIHVLRLGMGGGFKTFTAPINISDFGNGLTLHKVKSSFTLRRNGTILGDALWQNVQRNDNWFLPNSPSAGDTLWVKAVRLGGLGISTEGLVVNTIYQLSSDRTWYLDNETSPGVYTQGAVDINLRYDFYSNAGGTGTPVNQIFVNLEREWAV